MSDQAISRLGDLIAEGEALSDRKRRTALTDLEDFKTRSVDALIPFAPRIKAGVDEIKSVEFELVLPKTPRFGKARVLDQDHAYKSLKRIINLLKIARRMVTQGEPVSSDLPSGTASKPPLFSFSPDFANVVIRGERFMLTGRQAQIIEALYGAHQAGRPECTQASLLEGVDSVSKRLRDVFKSSPEAFKRLITSPRRGFYRLDLPDLPNPHPGIRR